MSKTDNSKAIEADLQFRSLSETVKATKEWWHLSAVTQERRDNILSSDQLLMNREKISWRSGLIERNSHFVVGLLSFYSSLLKSSFKYFNCGDGK